MSERWVKGRPPTVKICTWMLVTVAVFVCLLNYLCICYPTAKKKQTKYSFIFRACVSLTQYFAVDQIDVLTELFFLFFGRFLDLAQVCKGDVLGVEGLCARMQLGARACVYMVGYLSDMCAVGMYLCTCAQVYFLIHEFKFFRELLGQFVIF